MTAGDSNTFFVDRCLGSVRLAAAFKALGITVEVHDDHFPQSALDEEWLPVVGERGWIVLTKDARIAKRTSERLAVTNANIRMFVLVTQDLSSIQMIKIFQKAFVHMQAFAIAHPAPFIAKVYKDGRVEMWKDSEDLLTELNDLLG